MKKLPWMPLMPVIGSPMMRRMFHKSIVSGSLPGAWGRPLALPMLNWLDVSANNISGSLPTQWGQPNSFPNLRRL